MKLLLDENLRNKLKYRFRDQGIDAFTVKDMGWLGKENVALLNLMLENNFTAFITKDNILSFQNNFVDYPLSVFVLIAHDNTYQTIMKFFEAIVKSIKVNYMGTGVFVIIDR